MISMRRGVCALSLGIIIAATTSAHTWSRIGVADTSASETSGVTCLNCLYLSGWHNFLTGSPGLCQGENCEQNNCRACGGDSDCHEEPRQGSCHVECDCTPHENEVALGQIPELDLALAASDVERLAVLIMRGQGLEFNRERNAVQVRTCRRVVRQASLSSAQVSALDDALLRLAQGADSAYQLP